MVHKFEYELDLVTHGIESAMVNIGDDPVHTAMAKTVGLPVGICAKLILSDQIQERGVMVPTSKAVYLPILEELKTFGIEFQEKEYCF